MYAFCVCRACMESACMYTNGIPSTGFIFLLFFLFCRPFHITANGKMHKTTAKYLLCAVFFFFLSVVFYAKKSIYSSVQLLAGWLLPAPTVPQTQQQKLPLNARRKKKKHERRRMTAKQKIRKNGNESSKSRFLCKPTTL